MDLVQVLKEKEPTIVDVRQGFECLLGKAKGAINIPLGDIPNRIDEFKEMKKPIVVYCQSGGRSAQAMGFLMANGVKEIHNGGGIADVKRAQSKL